MLQESIALPKDMVEATLKLLQPVKWHGVAMVHKEFDAVKFLSSGYQCKRRRIF